MEEGRIIVLGIGPGSMRDITRGVVGILKLADVIVGYKDYFAYVKPYLRKSAILEMSGMKSEMKRAEQAFMWAKKGKLVAVISSGDASIYGMTSLILEMKKQKQSKVKVECYPGVSAVQKAAAQLGAPIGHDFCIISLSDLLTPWPLIEKRIRAAAQGDFVTAIYNPRSMGRDWQLQRCIDVLLEEGCSPSTPVGYVKNAGRANEEIHFTILKNFKADRIDMNTLVIIGNSQTYNWGNTMITPRGYYQHEKPIEAASKGQEIMIRSFRTIEKELKGTNYAPDFKWALLHAIHTTADFDMEKLLWMDKDFVTKLSGRLRGGMVKTIVTDVTMIQSGIRKAALQKLGLTVKCYIGDATAGTMAKEENITRAQAGIRVAVQNHPNALYVIGNAPTALMELCDLIRKKKALPIGIIACPVGFVHVEESKFRLRSFEKIQKMIIQGRKGGSTLAATLTNAVLTFEKNAEELIPGKDV